MENLCKEFEELEKKEKDLEQTLCEIKSKKKKVEGEIEYQKYGDVLEDRWFYSNELNGWGYKMILFHSTKSPNKYEAIRNSAYLGSDTIWDLLCFYGDVYVIEYDRERVHCGFVDTKRFSTSERWGRFNEELDEDVIQLICDQRTLEFLDENQLEETIRETITGMFTGKKSANSSEDITIDIDFKVNINKKANEE